MIIAINFEGILGVTHTALRLRLSHPTDLFQPPSNRVTAAQSDAKLNITGSDALHCSTHLLIGLMQTPREVGPLCKQNDGATADED
jgi:hypothetical protein